MAYDNTGRITKKRKEISRGAPAPAPAAV
ncbi:hypothetical protein RDI58_014796 [Solanum bulbocastanum]|uniref:Uncharacterized protein n=1 Tax=Solanum bulbocastanum TaxID=147425 RepID=A0AAN8TIX3_SOLBU